jgi:hypothetical protein
VPDSKQLADAAVDYWPLLAGGAAAFAAYLELKFKVANNSKELKEVKASIRNTEVMVADAVNSLKADIREDQREIRDDIKKILLRVGGD